VRHVTLVEDTTEEVDEDGDNANDGEHGARAHRLFRGFGATAGGLRAHFEEVGAFFGVGAYV
jgi:hypothetical protein